MDYALVGLALLFISLSQVLQKLAARKVAQTDNGRPVSHRFAACKETWWAILSLMAGTLVWLAVLYRMDVSKAFPLLSLGYVLVLLASRHYLHETISAQRWAGVAAIIAGITLLSLP